MNVPTTAAALTPDPRRGPGAPSDPGDARSADRSGRHAPPRAATGVDQRTSLASTPQATGSARAVETTDLATGRGVDPHPDQGRRRRRGSITRTARPGLTAEMTGMATACGIDLRIEQPGRRRLDRIGRVVSEVSTMIGRSIRLARRNVDTLIMAMLLPLMIMALFVYVFGGAIDRTGGYVDYVVPGIVLLCVGFGAASTAVPVAADMNEGMIDRLRSLPIHPAAVLSGHVVASVVRNAVSTVIVVVAAIAMGFRPDASVLEWLALAGLLLLYVLALSWFAAGVGTVARNAESAGMAGFFMLFLPYLSSAFVDPSTMPGPLRVISEHQPITPVTETARGLLTGTPIGNDAWLALAWSLGLLLASVIAATAFYRRRARR